MISFNFQRRSREHLLQNIAEASILAISAWTRDFRSAGGPFLLARRLVVLCPWMEGRLLKGEAIDMLVPKQALPVPVVPAVCVSHLRVLEA